MMLTLFTWGYWGWGNATRELIRGIDAAERRRGYKPPVFVDVRLRRNVRAKGFNGVAFEKVVGSSRYRWMRGLGNRSIVTGDDHIVIDRPEEAKNLLHLAIALAKRNRRVLFFCSCEDIRAKFCHRRKVATLLLEEAKRAGKRVQITEWPGDDPITRSIRLPTPMLASIMHGRRSLPLSKSADVADFAGLPWGSIVKLKASDHAFPIVSGPAKYQSGWRIPVLERGTNMDEHQLRGWAKRFRKQIGLDARTV
jgi:hypothetical protein